MRWGAQKKEKNFVLTSSDGLASHLPDLASYTPPELQMFVELFRKKNIQPMTISAKKNLHLTNLVEALHEHL